MESEFLITTIDNPYNPYTEEDAWYNFDTTYGYHTYATIARMAGLSSSMSDEEQKEKFIESMKNLLALNPMYVKIKNDDSKEETMKKLKNLREILFSNASKEDNGI